MTDNEKILHRALAKACKFIRENPPSEITPYLNDAGLMGALMDNGEDPEGFLYSELFLTRAFYEVKGNEG
jgi:hypothetical protein